MRRFLRLVALATVLAAGTVAGSGTVLAQQTLEEAKAAGLVGERPDGLLGAVPAQVAPDVRALVESVNAQRLERYREVARGNDTPVGQVQALAGRQLIAKTPTGQWVMTASGQWTRK